MNFALVLVVAIVGLAICGAFALTRDARQALLARRVQHLQAKQDERDFQDYEVKREELRKKFDPNSVWNEATSVPTEYALAVGTLNRQYRQMLHRRNGWTDKDFQDLDL